MTNTTPRPLQSVEEVVETFEKSFVDTQYVIGTNKKAYQEWKDLGDAEEAISWFRTILTQRDKAHKEAMREMVRDVLATLREPYVEHEWYIAEVEAIARSRGVLDKQ